MFAAGRGSTDIAKESRVSARSVQRWRQARKAAGRNGVRPAARASRPKLSDGRTCLPRAGLPHTHGHTGGVCAG
ncbi:hypothetical protein ACFYZT_33030 [Streptomyces sp. NPDC001591]|uniref:hypothetical protein n=1 Tax=Streptomyces sp. NPDC001591 TaxID=3364589 RepID=UPI00368AB0B9